MNCGAPIGKSDYCTSCGFHVEVQKKIWQLSNTYYNLGLDKAQIRDLSGAIDLLKRSLKFNKLNVQARNLLGLVYFETGEAVAALSEWIISKNIMPENNIASEYIERLQQNANKLDVINQTIKKYNDSLQCCRKGSEDVAVIQLKKILNQNPKLIKGYHLLALIYLKKEEYEKARRILKKAAKIDKTNSTTLRFLREVDEQTGTITSLEPRRWAFGLREKEEKVSGNQSIAYRTENDVVIQPPTFRESSMAATLLNLGFGFLVGACLVWFLMVPANTQRINKAANEKVVSYSNTMATQSAEMNKLQEQIDQSEETVASAQQQIEDAQNQTSSYENLIKAMYITAAKGTRFEKEIPIALRIVARFEPPKSTSKKKQQQMISGELHVMKKPDIDNIVKVVADALNGVAYKDDTQIVFVAAKKAYSAEEGLDVIVEEYKATE